MNSTIGQQLRQARESRALTIEQAASATRIRAHYLQAIEASEWGALPSPVHARGFLRAYADFLGLEAELLVGDLDGSDLNGSDTLPPVKIPEPQPQPEINESAQRIHEEAGAIFVDIGQQLLRQRELLGLTLEDVERYTHLRQHYLRALEAGDQEGAPLSGSGARYAQQLRQFPWLEP